MSRIVKRTELNAFDIHTKYTKDKLSKLSRSYIQWHMNLRENGAKSQLRKVYLQF